ncbi:MAG TPA: choice-of-anchor R domain-containing protein [Terriglobales bacterium]|nr:choice-of-anchor R domain-containing protein [Terriglobales bacterium]
MTKLRLTGLLVVLALCIASAANASDIVYNNFGNNWDYQCCVGGTLGGPNSPVGWVIQANQFTAGVSGSVSEIDVAIGWVTGTNGATVSLWTDNGGIPGVQLGSWDIGPLPNFGTNPPDHSTITGISGINVTAGQTYFLMASTPNDTWDAWNWNSTGAVGLVDFSTDGGATWNQAFGSTLYAFEVLANQATPEPGTFALLGTGLLALGAGLRRKFSS